jgi:hypothetical protein
VQSVDRVVNLRTRAKIGPLLAPVHPVETLKNRGELALERLGWPDDVALAEICDRLLVQVGSGHLVTKDARLPRRRTPA